jgi:NTF2 fold immunity protein
VRTAISALILLLFAATAYAQQPASEKGYAPAAGFVPDSQTAIRIAVAVWTPIYGERQIMSEQPFVATLANGVWTVTGTLPRGSLGGTAVAKIAKADGRILFVQHYQ